MSTKSRKWRSLILCAPLACSHAWGTQRIAGSDRDAVQVNISARELNRLAIDGRRIVSVVPAQPGTIASRKDETQGVLYFTMSTQLPAQGTVSLFVTDDQHTNYKLVLVPRPVGGEDIVLLPPIERSAAGGADARAPSYQRAVKNLVLAMADGDGSQDGAERVPVNKEVALWQEASLVLSAKYLAADLVGERYRLTNVSRADMLLAEQELFRPGVRAVAIVHQTLPPGASTDIYIVRERKAHE